MIALVVDLVEIDRELEALGSAPDATAGLIERVLGGAFSSDRIDEDLASLAAGASESWSASPSPGHAIEFVAPAAGFGAKPVNARSTLIGQPSSAEPAIAARASAIVTPAIVAPERDTAVEQPSPLSNLGALVEGMPQENASELDAVIDGRGEAGEPEHEPLRAHERSATMEALLDQDLDPRDFPQSEPPPPKPASVPPPAASSAADDDNDDFELLVEDDEILEIEDIELVEDE